MSGAPPRWLDEIEARAAHSTVVQGAQSLSVKRVVDDGDAAVARGVGGDAVEHGAVVGAVAARLHDHGARDAETVVQRASASFGASCGV